ncbi:MAG: right-handed parallel beta-helix repeat-containing protein, partial [Gammaproteobacteria bacterium]|nr:right-handed parallel beta-helix repeat-containing protein [Gammaproteobacteria bacterium]
MTDGEIDSLSVFNFPFTRVNESFTATLYAVNIGSPDLEFESPSITGDGAFSTTGQSSVLSFMDTLEIPITFSPTATGAYNGTLILGSNDPDEGVYNVALFGESAEHIILAVPTFYATIQEAIVAAYPEDTVEVLSGTYEESLDLLDKDLVLRSVAGPDSTFIEGDGEGPVLTISGGQSNLTMVSGFTLTGGGGTGGGGVLVDGEATPNFQRLILAANTVSGNGAGMLVLSGSAALDHITMSGNTAGGSGGAVHAAAGLSAAVTIDNSILWNNGTTEIGGFDGDVTITYSIVAGGADGAIDADPLFVDGSASDFSLQWHSPAIDAGDPAGDPDLDGTITDMGALYYDQTYQPPDSPVGLSYVPGSGEITLSWTANEETDLTHYVVYKGSAPDALESLAVVTAPTAEYVDTALDPSMINYYALTAVDTASLASDTTAILTVSFPTLSTSDDVLSFGDIRVGITETMQLTLSNTGSDTLFVDSIYVADDLSGFSVALGEMNTSQTIVNRL